jgi:hypothetical protein
MKFEKWYEENFGPVEPGVPFHLSVLKFAYESGAEIERQAIWDILINYASRDDLSDDDESLLLHLGRLIQARSENGLR